jgi:cysteate synthase
MGHYRLFCPECEITFDDVFTNLCPVCGNAGPLVKVNYQAKEFQPKPLSGFWKFIPWLPCDGWNENIKSQTIVYKSTGLAKELELKNLFVAFNGYWPEKDANMLTCTFKELEAPPTFQRAKEKCIDNLVISSAGNTAQAFITAAQYYDIDLYVVVPYSCIKRLVLPFPVPKHVIVIAANADSDYTDSIIFAGRMANDLNMVPEGGARNIARRDGMGTVMLESVLQLNRIPDHYFQAVGSGTGAIAATEAAERLIGSGQFEAPLPKLHLSQNKPFTPLVDAWKSESNELINIQLSRQRKCIDEVFAKVLTNRHPPYSVGGGVYDILSASSGLMYGVTNEEAKSMKKLFESTEDIDLVPAACVAVASLVQAVASDTVKSEDTILLNITGGGKERLWEDFEKHRVEPDVVCEATIEMQELRKTLEGLHG